jgi:RNA polymerase sigma factor (sigma-70 family)
VAVPLSLPHADIVLDLFEQYYHRVYCFCRRSLTPDGSEDIAQEVFTRLLQIERLPEMSISVSYLIKIADNLIKRRYNRNQRFQRFLEGNDGYDRGRQTASMHDDRSDLELSDDLSNRLASLTPSERDAVELVVCQGLSYQEAAVCMGVPISTVNNWKYRGLQKLKDSHALECHETDMERSMAG